MPLRTGARTIAVTAVFAVAVAVAGCGGEQVQPATTALAPGSVVSPARYLADADAAAAAARDAFTVMRRLPDRPTAEALRAQAPALAAAQRRADLAAQRIAAARLEDARLEAQRRRVAPLYVAFGTALRTMAAAARQGDVVGAAAASASLAAAADRLRAAGAATK